MFAYNLEKFASLYASARGQRLWAFLTRPENEVHSHGHHRVRIEPILSRA